MCVVCIVSSGTTLLQQFLDFKGKSICFFFDMGLHWDFGPNYYRAYTRKKIKTAGNKLIIAYKHKLDPCIKTFLMVTVSSKCKSLQFRDNFRKVKFYYFNIATSVVKTKIKSYVSKLKLVFFDLWQTFCLFTVARLIFLEINTNDNLINKTNK